jgi:hypothetical protein
MAVYVLLSFEDQEEAKEFVKEQIDPKGTTFIGDIYMDGADLGGLRQTYPEVVGVYRKPSMFCDQDPTTHRPNKFWYRRGQKYGWMVCTVCGKPSPRNQAVTGQHWEMTLGRNLLPPELCTDPEFNYRLRGASPVQWDDLLPEGTTRYVPEKDGLYASIFVNWVPPSPGQKETSDPVDSPESSNI